MDLYRKRYSCLVLICKLGSEVEGLPREELRVGCMAFAL